MLAEEIVRRMAQVPDGRRGARIRCALALAYRHDGAAVERVVEAAIEGRYRRVRPINRYGLDFLIAPCCICPHGDVIWRNWAKQRKPRIGQRRTAIERADPYLREIARMRCAS